MIKRWWIKKVIFKMNMLLQLFLFLLVVFLEFSIIWSLFQFFIFFGKLVRFLKIYQKQQQINSKSWRFLSSKLDIWRGNLIWIKFLKDPSTRGNSPNFSKPKMKMKPTLPSIKPVNKGSPAKSKLSKWANLVKSTGIGPMKGEWA